MAIPDPGITTHHANVAFVQDELAGYPEKWKRLRDEVLSAIGQNEPTYQDLKDSKSPFSPFFFSAPPLFIFWSLQVMVSFHWQTLGRVTEK